MNSISIISEDKINQIVKFTIAGKKGIYTAEICDFKDGPADAGLEAEISDYPGEGLKFIKIEDENGKLFEESADWESRVSLEQSELEMVLKNAGLI